jgi:hypothetical protein
MPSQRVEFLRGLRRWLVPAALLTFTPKCALCVLGYVGLGTAIGLGGRELCGAPTEGPTPPGILLALLALCGAATSATLIAMRRRRCAVGN